MYTTIMQPCFSLSLHVLFPLKQTKLYHDYFTKYFVTVVRCFISTSIQLYSVYSYIGA